MWNIDFSALVLGGRWKTKCLSICCSWCFRLCFRHPEIRRVTHHHCAPVIATIKNRWIFVDLQTSHVSLPEGDGKPPFSVCHSYLHFGHNWHSHYFKIDKVFCSLFTARRKIAVPRCKCSFLGSLRWLSNQGRWRRNQRWHWNLDRKIIFLWRLFLEDIVLLAAFTSFTKMCQYSCVKWHHLCFPRIAQCRENSPDPPVLGGGFYRKYIKYI